MNIVLHFYKQILNIQYMYIYILESIPSIYRTHPKKMGNFTTLKMLMFEYMKL